MRGIEALADRGLESGRRITGSERVDGERLKKVNLSDGPAGGRIAPSELILVVIGEDARHQRFLLDIEFGDTQRLVAVVEVTAACRRSDLPTVDHCAS